MHHMQLNAHLSNKTQYHIDDWGTYVVFRIKTEHNMCEIVLFGDHETSSDLVEMARAVNASIDTLTSTSYITDPWQPVEKPAPIKETTIDDEIPY